MADDVVIRAEGLGKNYVIGHEGERERYTALRDVMARGARKTWRKAGEIARGRIHLSSEAVEEFWALKDVSFEVKRGDVLGLIGRNGAGKSTLLKVLSRITEPSEGRVTIKGRVASLLEVGTGFHPELTGRENIYLNGAILGMSRAEIKRKFDEIVAFAEVEKFLDTPVKRYSSGMYVRLAFAVAAHLESEILVIDEVLAVGDAEFQEKCLGTMRDVAGHGRTVLFVSHNMSAIRQLCTHGLVLSGGRISFDGPVGNAIAAYVHTRGAAAARYVRAKPKTASPCIAQAAVEGLEWNDIAERLDLIVSIVVSAPDAKKICIDFRLKDDFGAPLAFASTGAFDSTELIPIERGDTGLIARLDISALAVGRYTLSIDINVPWVGFHDRAEDCVEFSIAPEHWHNSLNPLRQDHRIGAVLLPVVVEESESSPSDPIALVREGHELT